MNNHKTISLVLVMFLCLLVSLTSFDAIADEINGNMTEDTNVVVSLGQDLNENQRKEILGIFGVGENARIIYVTNDEEKEYLNGYINESVIGTRAISSAYVMKKKEGEGIEISTYNITWVTDDMFKNALVTAGVKDARVKVAAPVKVSGTAALTGIMKAFEGASGIEISEEKKRVANEELAKTGEIAEDIGKDEASRLMRDVKKEVVEKGLTEDNEIRKMVVEITGDLNITLNESQIEEIVSLMKNISNLDLTIKDIEKQIENIGGEVKKISRDNEEVKSLLQRILDFIKQLFSSIFSWVGNIVSLL